MIRYAKNKQSLIFIALTADITKRYIILSYVIYNSRTIIILVLAINKSNIIPIMTKILKIADKIARSDIN